MSKRSIWAVVASALFIIIVTTVIDVVLHLLGAYPPMDQPINDAQSVLGTSYRIVIGIAGGWLTARMAPRRPMKQALALGCIGAALGLVGLLVTWNKSLGPRWYPVAHVVLAIPETWIGGKIFESRTRVAGQQ